MLVVTFWFVMVIAGVVIIPLFLHTSMKTKDRRWYEDCVWYPVDPRDQCRKRRRRVLLAPPTWIFPVVWTILYALIVAASILYARTVEDDLAPPVLHIGLVVVSTVYAAVFSLMLVNLAFNLYWTTAFFRKRSPVLAAVVCFVVLATSIAIAVLFGMYASWLIFGLYVAYPIWSAFAFALNINWIISVWPMTPIAPGARDTLPMAQIPRPGDIQYQTMKQQTIVVVQ
jgi:tryptophan-rich sensory protein